MSGGPGKTMTATAFDSYVICTSLRSGSTLLCSLLAATGVSGNPDSYFHQPSLAAWQADLGVVPPPSASEPEVVSLLFREAIAQGSAGTGMFGLRLQRHSFDFFMEKLALLHPRSSTGAERFAAAFGRTLFIHLRRDDKLEQAVSCVKARQSGLWHRAADGSELERLAPHQEPRYDADAIRAERDAMLAMDAAWEAWFGAEAIAPLRLTYDGLSADPSGALGVVLDRLGLDAGIAAGVTPGVAKLSDRTNHDWVSRFLAEEARAGG